MTEDRRQQIIEQMVQRFNENIEKGPRGARELLDKLLADADDPSRQFKYFGRTWRTLIEELKRRGNLYVAVLITSTKVLVSGTRSRVESVATTSAEAIATGIGNWVVAASLALSTLVAPVVGTAAIALSPPHIEASMAGGALAPSSHIRPIPGFSVADVERSTIHIRTDADSPAGAEATMAQTPDEFTIGSDVSVNVAGATYTLPRRTTVHCDPTSRFQMQRLCSEVRGLPSYGLIR